MATPEGRPGAAAPSASIPAIAGTLAQAPSREASIARQVQDAFSKILAAPPDVGLEVARRLRDQITILLQAQAAALPGATPQPSSIIDAPPGLVSQQFGPAGRFGSTKPFEAAPNGWPAVILPSGDRPPNLDHYPAPGEKIPDDWARWFRRNPRYLTQALRDYIVAHPAETNPVLLGLAPRIP